MRLYQTMPNHGLLGTKVLKEDGKTPYYKYTSVKDVVDSCRNFAAGCLKLDLVGTV